MLFHELSCILAQLNLHALKHLKQEGTGLKRVVSCPRIIAHILGRLYNSYDAGFKSVLIFFFNRRQAHLCILANNCDEPMYVKLVEALCAEHGINLMKVTRSKEGFI